MFCKPPGLQYKIMRINIFDSQPFWLQWKNFRQFSNFDLISLICLTLSKRPCIVPFFCQLNFRIFIVIFTFSALLWKNKTLETFPFIRLKNERPNKMNVPDYFITQLNLTECLFSIDSSASFFVFRLYVYYGLFKQMRL